MKIRSEGETPKSWKRCAAAWFLDCRKVQTTPMRGCLVDKHLDLDVTYATVNGSNTHKHYTSPTPNRSVQVQPSANMVSLTKIFVMHQRKNYNLQGIVTIRWSTLGMQFLAAKKVVINEKRGVAFCDPDGDEHELDLN
jgi:hypothetical protein